MADCLVGAMATLMVETMENGLVHVLAAEMVLLMAEMLVFPQ